MKKGIGRGYTGLIAGLLIAILSACSSDESSADGSDQSDEMVRFVTVDYMDSSKIYRISKFRSGIGHDYSDSFENCRSMKHYYHPIEALDWSQLYIYAPVAGKITQLFDEGNGSVSDSQIWIESSEYPRYSFILFHVNHDPALKVGDTVAAGHVLGTNTSDSQLSDIAVGIATDAGWKLVSYFDVMSDALFQTYQGYAGITSREDLQISQAERDADPLVCDGETFQGEGSLENWVVINAP